VLSCLRSMAIYTLKAHPASSGQGACAPAARCKRGGRTKSASTSVRLSWRFFTVSPVWPPASPGPRDPSGVYEVGACGIRLVCLLLQLTGLNRFVGASYGTQQQVNRRVEEAIVAYRHEESARLGHEMPTKAIHDDTG